MMKSLHVCNLANVAYGYGKILREGGYPVDVRCHDLKHLMSQPEWDDLELNSANFPDEDDFFNNTADFGDYRRPDWFRAEDLAAADRRVARLARSVLPPWAKRWIRPYYHHMLDRQDGLGRRSAAGVGGRARGANGRANACELLCRESEKHGPQWRLEEPSLRAYRPHVSWMCRQIQDHEVIFAYVLSPIYTMLSHELPYVSVEIGTMRDIPFDGTEVGKLMALAYRQADHVLITNPDCNRAAQRLGIKDYSFCPHPLDEDIYVPARSDGPLRRQIMAEHGATMIIFAPARQNWDVKGNDKYFRAFAELLKHRPKALLIVPGWGQEVDRSKRLCAQLGVEARTVWLLPISERWMVKYYQAADLVLDQFNLAVFGLITPKAMSCGKPTVTSYEEGLHTWCFAEHPPVVSCSSEKDIFRAMLELGGSPKKRVEIGGASREWILKYFSKERVRRNLISAMKRAKQNLEAGK